jgi:hypothetical protein
MAYPSFATSVHNIYASSLYFAAVVTHSIILHDFHHVPFPPARRHTASPRQLIAHGCERCLCVVRAIHGQTIRRERASLVECRRRPDDGPHADSEKEGQGVENVKVPFSVAERAVKALGILDDPEDATDLKSASAVRATHHDPEGGPYECPIHSFPLRAGTDLLTGTRPLLRVSRLATRVSLLSSRITPLTCVAQRRRAEW